MKLKNQLLTISTFALLSMGSLVLAGSDPFIQQWKYFDGIDQTYILNIKESRAPGQNYHIDYNFSGGRFASDMCKIDSNTSFSCFGGVTVKRNDTEHSVQVIDHGDTVTFYDPNHMPPADPLTGNWVMNTSWVMDGEVHHAKDVISITKGKNNTEYAVTTSSSDDTGNHCSSGEPDIYHVTKNADETETLTHKSSYDSYSFKYNPQTKEITNPNPDNYFLLGMCVALADEGQILFTKQ